MKNDNKLIIFFLKQILNRILPDAVHVIYTAKGMSVELYIRKGIDTVKAQDHIIRFFLIDAECSPVLKVILHKFQRLHFIIPPVRILQLPGTDKIVIHRARHACGDPFAGATLIIYNAHLPFLICIYPLHINLSSLT